MHDFSSIVINDGNATSPITHYRVNVSVDIPYDFEDEDSTLSSEIEDMMVKQCEELQMFMVSKNVYPIRISMSDDNGAMNLTFSGGSTCGD